MFRILIVDDSKAIHTFVRDMLSANPEIETYSVYDGTQAISLLGTQKNFDLVLLDWEMPNLDGPGTFPQIRKLLPTTPVLMMTSKNTTEDITYMLEMGVAEYLMKPFTSDILFEKIEFVTGRNMSRATA